MLRFVGDIGIYLPDRDAPDRDAIAFTALAGRLPVACRVRRSALTALGCAFQATPLELIDAFQAFRAILERVARFKWSTGQIARSRDHQPIVNIEDADVFGFHHASLRILVVEDNLLTADTIQDLLETGGCDVVGPASTVAAALDLVARSVLDGAVLDINLGGALSFPIAAALTERDIPFLFLTGNSDLVLPPQYRGMRRLDKSTDLRMLAEIVHGAFGQPSRLTH